MSSDCEDFDALADTVRKAQEYEAKASSTSLDLVERLCAEQRGLGYREALNDVAKALSRTARR